MPCSRAYFVNSAVLRIPNLRITFDLWNATVFWRFENRRNLFDGMSFRHQLHHFPLAVSQFAGGLPGPKRPTRQFAQDVFPDQRRDVGRDPSAPRGWRSATPCEAHRFKT